MQARHIKNLAGLLFLVGALFYMAQRNKELQTENQATEISDDLFLEEIQGEKALSWVKQENKRTQDKLEAHPEFEQLRKSSEKILTRSDKLLVAAQLKPGEAFNFWQDQNHKKGILRTQSWENYLAGEDSWQTLIDFDELSAEEERSWVYKGLDCLKNSSRCLVKLSDGGSDSSFMREFDLETKQFVKDGFSASASKSDYSWIDIDTLLVGDAFDKDSQTDSGYPKIVKLWQRGKTLSDGQKVFEGEQSDVAVWMRSDDDLPPGHKLLMRWLTFYAQELYYYDGESTKLLKIDPKHSLTDIFSDQIIVELKKDDYNHKSGDLVSIPVEQALQGEIVAQLLFSPSSKQSISSVRQTKDQLLVQVLDNVKEKLFSFRLKNGKWESDLIQLPQDGNIGVFGTSAFNNDFLVSYESFLVPETLYAVSSDLNLKQIQNVPPVFDASKIQMQQKFAKSADGTEVPYFIMSSKDMNNNGRNPTLIYGYGGFEISLSPNYMGVFGKNWLERGGVYVIANIRGGGEYGPKWHQAALKHNRHKAYEDFEAVAEALISDKVTSPEHLAIRGGSNGGLLVGAVATRRPELFNGVICAVPLLDMLRFHKLLAGASWMAEYGNPENETDATYLAGYSPYHQVKKETKYPEIFFVTSTLDDRVHPSHARRMAHKLQSFGKPFYYYENIEGGHSASADLEQRAYQYALEISYLLEKIGDPKAISS